jgi:hypothetical protein
MNPLLFQSAFVCSQGKLCGPSIYQYAMVCVFWRHLCHRIV